MICPRCQVQNSADAVFCDHCGLQLESPCSNCGESNRRGAKFCRRCGRPFDKTLAATPESTASAPSPEAYTPGYLAEKILASRANLEGERKQVTVLFADIKGSTQLLEGLDPEGAQKLIDPVLHLMMEAVHRYEGTVNQVLGDGIMALFGAPLAHEDHAVRACYAALAMQEEMRRHRDKLGRLNGELQIGVGLNSGEVVVRSISNDLTIDYSALGHTTHLAARMQEFAGPGSILMTISTFREVEGFVQVKPLGSVEPKGVSQPVQVFELIGATSARKRLQAGVSRGLTPFVGRNREIDIFRELTVQAAAGHGQIFAMVGEAGLGKSRLVHQFINNHVPPDWFVLEATSVSYGKATPYYSLIELLRRYFAISEGEPSESIQTKIVDQILKLDETFTDVIPPILGLLNALPKADGDRPALWPNYIVARGNLVEAIMRFNNMDPQQQRRAVFDVLKRVFIRESQKQPLLVVFEDLHWIDGETQTFLDTVVESLPMARIVLLVNYRPGYTHTWAERTYYTRLRVEPLPTAGADELLQHLLGDNADLAPLKEMLIKRTEGNPFFLEETVRSLVETGILVGEKGAYRPGLRVESIRVPSTVQTVLADRIDRLPLEQKHLLQTAAVIGVIVPLRLLRAVAGLLDDELHGYLVGLQAAEFLHESNLFPEVEYTFKHALTNEVVYGALLHEKRTSLHARIVRALEEIKRDNLQDHFETLAHHALHGEVWDKAVVYLKQAGAKAVSRSAFRNAVYYFEQALKALGHLPETHDNLIHAVDLRVEIRNALFILGEFGRGREYLERAKEMAIGLNDRRRLGTILNLMTAHWQIQGNSEQAIASAEQALNHTAAPEHLDLHIVAHYFLGVAYHNVGQYDRAVGVLTRALSLVGDKKFELFGTTGIVSVVCRAWLIRCLAQIGKFDEAVPCGDEAIQTAMERNHAYSLVYAYYGVGVLSLIRGEFDKAVAVLGRGLEVCETADIPVQRPLITSCLGAAYAFLGRLHEALQLLESAVAHTASMKRMAGQAMRMAWLGEAYTLAGRTDEAEASIRQGLELCCNSKDKGSQAWLLRGLGDIKARRCFLDVELAEANYGEAIRLAQELEMRPLQAHCHLGLGSLYQQIKRLEKARTELLVAVELYRAMSMAFWLSKAEAALAELDK